MKYHRIKGGEKNLKTGQKWTKEEIIKVYHLYKKLGGVGLHERNPEIQKLAHELDRTVRSTEAQTLMFRNLERKGKYSHGNMNKLSKQVWIEFENDKIISNKTFPSNGQFDLFNSLEVERTISNQESNEAQRDVLPVIDEKESDEIEYPFLSYKEWNKRLIDFFFHSGIEGKEVPCFLIYKELFEEISNYKFTFSNFEQAIEKELRIKNYVKKFDELYHISIPHLISGKRLRKPDPEYFGFLIYLIFSLTESSGNNLSISNVYDRINDVGLNRFGSKWGKVNSEFARDTLEFVWKDLEDWSLKFRAKKIGYFRLLDPQNSQRKYVSRIERHALFNSGHFQQLFDILIEDGIVPKESISLEKWIEIFSRNKHKIGNSSKVLEYLRDDSDLRETTLKFINDYYKNNYTDKVISSDSGSVRKPSIPLLLCISELPQWGDILNIEDVHFRTYSSELEEDEIKFNGDDFSVEHELKEYSKKLELKWSPDSGEVIIIKGDSQRYSIKNNYKWLIHNRDLEEWIEVIRSTNASEFIVLVNDELSNLIKNNDLPIEEIYRAPWANYRFILFNALSESQFQNLNNLLGNKEIIEGSIEIEGEYLVDRRTTILKEFNSRFNYIGPIAMPELYVKFIDLDKEVDLIKLDQKEGSVFFLPEDTNLERKFFIYERKSNIKSHLSYSISSMNNKAIINIEQPTSKDQDGINLIDREMQDCDIFDIPNDFNRRDFNNTDFNTWQMKLWKVFKPTDKDYVTNNDHNFNYNENQAGEKLLRYLAISKSIDTYKFTSLVRELDPTISSQFSKRVLIYWRDLGYINFQSFGEKVKVTPTGLFFLETEKGLKAFLTGYRSEKLIQKIELVCNELNLILKITKHSEKHSIIFPHRIEIYDKLGELNRFKELADKLDIEYINNIENPLNSKFSVYQLACFYTQRSVNELETYLSSKPFYETDHHRKLIFDSEKCNWKESTKNVYSFTSNALIRYDGFKDRQIIHIYKDENGVRKLDDYALCSFELIKKDVFLQKRHRVKDVSDFYVPLNMSLPYWIEKGLLLINARIPELENYENKSYRVYKNIHDDIIKLIEKKLNQNTNII